MAEKNQHKEESHHKEGKRVPLDPPGMGDPNPEHQKGIQQQQEQERVLTAEDKKAIELAAKGIFYDLESMQEANRKEDQRRVEQARGDVEGLKGQPGAPGQGPLVPEQQIVNPGDTVTIATVTLGTLVSTLYPTNTAPTPPTLATWVNPGVLQLVYGDMSLVTLRFEARQFVPTQIRTY